MASINNKHNIYEISQWETIGTIGTIANNNKKQRMLQFAAATKKDDFNTRLLSSNVNELADIVSSSRNNHSMTLHPSNSPDQHAEMLQYNAMMNNYALAELTNYIQRSTNQIQTLNQLNQSVLRDGMNTYLNENVVASVFSNKNTSTILSKNYSPSVSTMIPHQGYQSHHQTKTNTCAIHAAGYGPNNHWGKGFVTRLSGPNYSYGLTNDKLYSDEGSSMITVKPTTITTTGITFHRLLSHPQDVHLLAPHQQFLRLQIEYHEATIDDVTNQIRGRNRDVKLGQVGIRCRHCSHKSSTSRQKGSVYFPGTTMGLYQAAQNMSTAHIQCGACTEMPDSIKEHFKGLIATKSFTTGAGRRYWDECGRSMGLVNTENGIFYAHNA